MVQETRTISGLRDRADPRLRALHQNQSKKPSIVDEFTSSVGMSDADGKPLEDLKKHATLLKPEAASPSSIPSTPLKPTVISTVEKNDSVEPQDKTQLKISIPTYVKNLVGPTHQRVGLPSGFIPYEWKELQVRPFGVQDICNLDKAKEEDNFSILIDTIGGCMDQNVRELTIPDWRYLMYWLRLNSYPKSPYKITWTSKYSNPNELIVNSTNLKIITFNMPAEEYKTWTDQGFMLPTVRDMEIFRTEDLDRDTDWLYRHAQYIEGDTVEEKIQNLKDFGIDGISLANEFVSKIDYGVDETIEATDTKFDAQKWLDNLTTEIAELTRRNLAISDNEVHTALELRIQDLEAKAKEIQEDLKANKEVLPEKETVNIPMDITSFFPWLYRT
jgi:hypothetical protein